MKTIFKNMTWMLSATLIMAACSDSLDESTNTPVQGPVVGEGYVKVAINMPTTSGNSTRSNDSEGGEDVTLEDGDPKEYNVENAILAFFKCNKTLDSGTTPETQATFVKAYALTKGDLGITGSTETPQVTEQVSVITEAPKVSDGEQLYVLAILNTNNDIVSVTDNGNLTVNKTELKEEASSPITLSKLQGEITSTVDKFIGSDKNQFTMTNAPLSDKAGVDSNIANAKAYTLVPVTVYDTKAQATAGNVAKIYVERVVAKVTLTTTGNAETIGVSGDGNSGDKVEITGWCLNVTNNSTKLVRDVSGFTTSEWLSANENSPARFAGTRGINASFGVASESSYYRIYWAEDCNYTSATLSEDFTTYSSTNAPATTAWNGLSTSTASNACYCLENTMNYDQQIQNRTTGVLIKTNYLTKFPGEAEASAKSFFICGTSSTKYPQEKIGEGSAKGGTDAFVTYVMTEADKLITDSNNKFGGTGLNLQNNLASGTYTDITDVFTFTATEGAKLTAQQNAVKAVVGSRISYYKDGENYYYSSLIRHFQDGEGVDIPTSGIASANDYTLKHLGRYGVVRNNWYEININSISGPGDPVIPEPGDDPDDTAEGYINCTINVLSWAKRSQNVDL